MQSTAGELEQKTKSYWRVSSVWNGRLEEELNVGDAITEILDTINMNPARPIHQVSRKLMNELIEGEGLSNPEETKLLTFPDAADLIAALTVY